MVAQKRLPDLFWFLQTYWNKKLLQKPGRKNTGIEAKKRKLKKLQKEFEMEKVQLKKSQKLAGDFEKEHARLLASIND